jgi:hypothetical protein
MKWFNAFPVKIGSTQGYVGHEVIQRLASINAVLFS